jgi:GH15 family glucan-1,4-alpha-glucosidase
MTWVALDNAVRLAGDLARPAKVSQWMAARDAVYEQILERGWSQPRAAFVQYPGSDVLDASILMMPITGFIHSRDPMWLSTLDAIEQDLVSDSLVYRYDPSASPDGLRGDEGTFSICTFWYVDALARAGRLDKARYCFEECRRTPIMLGCTRRRSVLRGAVRKFSAGVQSPFADWRSRSTQQCSWLGIGWNP